MKRNLISESQRLVIVIILLCILALVLGSVISGKPMFGVVNHGLGQALTGSEIQGEQG